MSNDEQRALTAVREWLIEVVLAEQLCPFAGPVVTAGSLRMTTTPASTADALLEALAAELSLLVDQPENETTLLIHPCVLADFFDYNDFLAEADGLLRQRGLTGVFQIASFHPSYQFAGTEPEDAENYSNRSPLPLLHILREDSVTQAIDRYPDVDQIPVRNTRRLNQIGSRVLAARLAQLRSRLSPNA